MSYTLYEGDCLDVMPTLEAECVDLILADLPYGTTECKWDSPIDLSLLWAQFERLIKPKRAIILTASQPFTSALVMSNSAWFRYSWVWNKAQSGNFAIAKYQPLKITEDVLVFSKDAHFYSPIMRTGKMRKRGGASKINPITPRVKLGYTSYSDQYYPTNVLDFPNCGRKAERIHPAQKSVALLEYLIRTYSNEGDTILDNTMGSGTTGVACMNTGRNFIGIEKPPADPRETNYFPIARDRIAKAASAPRQEALQAA